MPGNLEDAIEHAFRPAVVAVCRRLLDRSYQYASATHLTDAGSNDATFGFNLYWFNVHQFEMFAESAGVGIEVASTRPEFRLKIGDFWVACHRVGSSMADPIQHSFPRNPNGPGRLAGLNAIQLCLDLPIEDDPSVPSNLILAHMGNPDDGLQAIYVAVPVGTSAAGRVNEWRFTKLVWRADALKQVPDVPAPIDIRPPELSFRQDSATDESPA